MYINNILFFRNQIHNSVSNEILKRFYFENRKENMHRVQKVLGI